MHYTAQDSFIFAIRGSQESFKVVYLQISELRRVSIMKFGIQTAVYTTKVRIISHYQKKITGIVKSWLSADLWVDEDLNHEIRSTDSSMHYTAQNSFIFAIRESQL